LLVVAAGALVLLRFSLVGGAVVVAADAAIAADEVESLCLLSIPKQDRAVIPEGIGV
jgi:hypothetical protein